MGGLDSAEWLCRSLANRVGCAVVSIDYRLAPEYPFPVCFGRWFDRCAMVGNRSV